jgi:hypothetical protein
MNNRSTLQGLAVLLLSALTMNSMFSQTFWTETFGDPATSTNWLSGGTNAGTEVWTLTTDPFAGFMDPSIPGMGSPTVSDGYFYFDSDANGENNVHDITLTGVGNPADCSGKSGVKLRFYAQYSEFNTPAMAFVGISTDGTNFTDREVFANAQSDEVVEGTFTVSVPEADNQAQVWVRFRWVGDWEYHFKVDDVELFVEPGPVPCDQNPMALICDNLDTYVTTMSTGQQATWWTTWSGTLGTAEDGIVSTEQANTAPNSMKILSTAASGGPQDVILNLDNKTTGRYELKWQIYVPSGRNGYYNVQQSYPIGNNGQGDWNLNVFFNNNNDGRISDGANVDLATFKFPYDTWFECRHVFDLDNNIAAYYIADTFITKKAYLRNLGGIHFYGTNNISTFYVDDIEYVELPPITYNVDSCGAAVDLALYFGQAPGIAQTTGLYDNTMMTAAINDPTVTCWNEDVSGSTDVVNSSMWYTFTGDGSTYHIETVPCNATNYIGTAQDDPGDTQMLIYAGDNCSNLEPVLCNDDLYPLTGDPDWRAGLDIETVNGQNYYMLIDGFEFNGVLASGEFCIEITQQPSVACADGVVGTYSVDNNGLVCFGQNLNELINIDPASFVIPNLGPVYGMVWSITAAPVGANEWPGTIPGVASDIVNPSVTLVSVPNNGTGFSGQFYLTVSVVAGGTLINPGAARVFNVDPSGGCFFNGPSVLVTFLPNLAPISANPTITQPTAAGNDGAIDLVVTGGLADPPGDPSFMIYSWTGPGGFTASTQNISGLAPGDYTVSITDPSGCVPPFVTTFGVTTGITDPASVKALSISPNPTSNTALLNLELAAAADVRLELSNMLGQVLQTFDAGKRSSLSRSLDLSSFADGTYLLRVTIDDEIALRRIVLQR